MIHYYTVFTITILLLPCWVYPSDIFCPVFYQWCQETRTILPQPYDAIINLGDNCQIAYQMRLQGLRNESLPFDWIITPFEALQKILKDSFEHFLKKENLIFIHTHNEKHILDTYYGIKFLHDFKLEENFLKDYDTVQQTYSRRIARFFRILKESRHALFIRKKITKEQALALRTLLQTLCPNNDFLILAVGNTHDMKTDWNLAHIKNVYLAQADSWKGDPEAWKVIFTELGLNMAPQEDPIPLFKINYY